MHQNIKINWDEIKKYSLIKFKEYADSLSEKEIKEIFNDMSDNFIEFDESGELIFPYGGAKQMRIFARLLCEKLIRLYELNNYFTKDDYKRIKRSGRNLLKKLN
jgi:hypothetical protein